MTSPVKLVWRTRARIQASSYHSDSGNWAGDGAGILPQNQFVAHKVSGVVSLPTLIRNIAYNNFNVCLLVHCLQNCKRQFQYFHYLQHCVHQFQRLSTPCNIARNSFKACHCCTLHTTMSPCIHYLQHCAQQF